MDMWEPTITATRVGLPAGDQRIVFDRFHVMREMTTAVDRERPSGGSSHAGTAGPPARGSPP